MPSKKRQKELRDDLIINLTAEIFNDPKRLAKMGDNRTEQATQVSLLADKFEEQTKSIDWEEVEFFEVLDEFLAREVDGIEIA